MAEAVTRSDDSFGMVRSDALLVVAMMGATAAVVAFEALVSGSRMGCGGGGVALMEEGGGGGEGRITRGRRCHLVYFGTRVVDAALRADGGEDDGVGGGGLGGGGERDARFAASASSFLLRIRATYASASVRLMTCLNRGGRGGGGDRGTGGGGGGCGGGAGSGGGRSGGLAATAAFFS